MVLHIRSIIYLLHIKCRAALIYYTSIWICYRLTPSADNSDTKESHVYFDIMTDAGIGQTTDVLLQLEKQRFEGNRRSGVWQWGMRFQANVRNGTRSAGWPLFHWLSPWFGPSQSTQTRYLKNVCRSWKATTVMPWRTQFYMTGF